MKPMTHRVLALVLVFVLCISLLPANLAAAVKIDYVTGDVDSYKDVIANWGQRGTTATYLSENAELFYQNEGTSYSALSALSGTSQTSSVPSSVLYQELQALMAGAHDKKTSYDATRPLYRYTDCQNSDISAISSFYSGKSIGPAWDGGATWNREHTWPQSKSPDGSAEKNDIMMLRPTWKSENGNRGNTAYGKSSGYYNPNTASNGSYDVRGDVARIALYVYVRWGNTEKMWGSNGVIESREVLLEWMEVDPVDTWELGRNDSVESITGTRNVFVDYPELAFLLFDEQIPADMDTPSGNAAGSVSYTIQAVSSNEAHGTVTLEGNVISAKPAEGYVVSGFTVVSGTATVTRDGNLFTVKAASDCQIRINFAKPAAAVLTFMENGTTAATVDSYEGTSITLPGHKGTVVTGYSFVGWIPAALEETTSAPSVIYKSGDAYTVTESTTLYALYSREEEADTGDQALFLLHTGDITVGNYLIVYAGGAMTAQVVSERLAVTDVTIANNSITNPDASLIWHVDKTDGYYTFYNSSESKYAGGTGVNNKAGLLDAVTDYARWTAIDKGSTYEFENKGNKADGVNYTLRRYEDLGFACYSNASNGVGGPVSLYKQVTSTIFYSTETKPCEHANTQQVPAKDPTCTEAGYKAGVFCKDCSVYISGHETVPATGHSYTSVVTPPTATEKGYTTYTCSECGHSYTADETDPLGQSYTVSFVVPEGVPAVADLTCNNRGILLPEAGVPTGEETYIFAGWATQGVNNTQQAPKYYMAGSTYVAQSNITFYAVYAYATGEPGTGAWKRVTDASALAAGMQLVLAVSDQGVVAGEVSKEYLTHVAASFSSDKSTLSSLPKGALVLTLGGNSSAWTLANESGTLLGATNAKNIGWNKKDSTWTISIEGGLATVTSGTASYGKLLYNVNNPRFTTYTSEPNKSMLLPELYSRDFGTGTVFYTSVISKECAHDGETVLKDASQPNYLKDGYTGDLYCMQCSALVKKGETISNNPFVDVGNGNRFKTPILWAYYEGITVGKTETTFEPNAPVTRAQFVFFLWKAEGKPEPASNVNPFTDVTVNNRFYKAILWAYHAGITSGKTETTFAPGDTCTRGQVMRFLYCHAGEPDVANTVNPFTDITENNRFYSAVMWAYSNKITSGKTETTFDLNSPCTRAYVVAFLYNYMGD